MAERVTARIAAFMPGASPPDVRIPIDLILDIVIDMCILLTCKTVRKCRDNDSFIKENNEVINDCSRNETKVSVFLANFAL
jgi:hypothetical protein